MLTLITIVKNGEPWIERHYPQFSQLTIPWKWIVVEGTASPMRDTSWCKPVPAGLSTDGTTQYLDSLTQDARVLHVKGALWNGKTAQINVGLDYAHHAGVLMQVDADELWTAKQLEKIYGLFGTYAHVHRAYFWCNYYVGPNLVTMTSDGYGNRAGREWLRAWRYTPGMKFDTHEPPVLAGNKGGAITRDATRSLGLVFNHMAYATPAQVKQKEEYYGYRNALQCWLKLQKHKCFPAHLHDFLPWVERGVMVGLAIGSK